jgi:hypothetical protein
MTGQESQRSLGNFLADDDQTRRPGIHRAEIRLLDQTGEFPQSKSFDAPDQDRETPGAIPRANDAAPGKRSLWRPTDHAE